MKDELIKKRQELQQRIDAIHKDIKNGLNADSGERAVELENRDTLLEIERIALEDIAKIDEQLNQLSS